ncbi:MAG: hypothetical protein IPJ34_02145 [Myxococcales bacterium]|nr:hypothetical protein [Myxococcales bacterium]
MSEVRVEGVTLVSRPRLQAIPVVLLLAVLGAFASGWLGFWIAFFGLHLCLGNLRGSTTSSQQLLVADGEVCLVEPDSWRLLFAVAQVRDALVAPDPAGARLVVDRGVLRPRIELVFDRLDHARDVLRALGTDSAQRTSTFSLVGRLQEKVSVGAAAAASLAGLIAWAFSDDKALRTFWLVTMAVLVVVGLVARVGRLTVGRDGLRVRRLGSRHVAAANIRDVDDVGGAVVVEMAGGERLRLPMARDRELVVERLRELKEGEARRIPELPARGARPVHEWVEELRAAVRRPDTFRAASLTVEDLWSVVDAPNVGLPQRAVAAAGLHEHLDDNGRARLRRVAATCASPRLRLAIEAAADVEDDEALEGALDALSRGQDG